MNTESMASNWYYTTVTGERRQTGPISWEQLHAAAQAGALGPNDLVWNPQLPDWLPAARVPGLLPCAGAPVAQPRIPQAPLQYVAAPNAAAAPAPRRRSSLLAWLIPLIALIIVGAGLGIYFGFFYDRADTTATDSTSSTVAAGSTTDKSNPGAIDLGVRQVKAPDPAKVVATKSWGEVPINQIVVMLADGKTRTDAENLAQTVGGSVVGELAYINAYQIETAGTTEAELQAALTQIQTMPGVTAAAPNYPVLLDTEIWGVRRSPLNDPVYAGENGRGFELIGAPKAWTYVKGCGLPLSPVHVGVVDDGLWRGDGEYDGDASVYFPDKEAGELSGPLVQTNDATGESVPDPRGSHGGMVIGALGADPENGGRTGVGSPALGNNLTISAVNIFEGDYGDGTRSYAMNSLAALETEVEAGAKIINCSWGSDQKDLRDLDMQLKAGQISQDYFNAEAGALIAGLRQTAAFYKAFFDRMSREHPDVLFVCAAGNDGWAMDGSTYYPGGLNLPNMITVGNVLNDGRRWKTSNSIGTAPGREFEVTLAAPGHEIVQGVDKDGNPVKVGTVLENGVPIGGGGTSAAAPQVSAAAAILLSLDPELTAGEIKQILSDTSRPGPAELGGKILAVDLAVLEVINRQREHMGLPRVTGEELERGGVIDAVAISQDGEPNTWMVKAIVESLPSVDGAEITITATTGTKIDGELTQRITRPGEVVWIPVTVPNEVAEITVTRSDNGASSVITFELIDLNGYWEGTFAFTKADFSPEIQAQFDALAENPPDELQGCDLSSIEAALNQIIGKPCPMTLDIVANEDGTGTAQLFIDFTVLGKTESAEAQEMGPIPLTWSGRSITISATEDAQAMSITGTASQVGDDQVMKGQMVITVSAEGKMLYRLYGEWTVAKH